MTDIIDLMTALKENALDPTLHSVFADFAEENQVTDADPPAHRLLSQYLNNDCQIWNSTSVESKERAADVLLSCVGIIPNMVKTALANSNGKRRERLLSYLSVFQCVESAYQNGFAWISGGNVANKYGYPAWQTACVAAKSTNGTVRIVIGVIPASNGASPTNRLIGLRANAKKEEFQEWANKGESL